MPVITSKCKGLLQTGPHICDTKFIHFQQCMLLAFEHGEGWLSIHAILVCMATIQLEHSCIDLGDRVYSSSLDKQIAKACSKVSRSLVHDQCMNHTSAARRKEQQNDKRNPDIEPDKSCNAKSSGNWEAITSPRSLSRFPCWSTPQCMRFVVHRAIVGLLLQCWGKWKPCLDIVLVWNVTLCFRRGHQKWAHRFLAFDPGVQAATKNGRDSCVLNRRHRSLV